MTELLTSAQMRALEGEAMASGAVTGIQLMERAGRAVVAAIFEEWPELAPEAWESAAWAQATAKIGADGLSPSPDRAAAPAAGTRSAVVLCGPGNNGGDGFVVARLLTYLGWRVRVAHWGDAAKLPPDARANCAAWGDLGAVVTLDQAFDGRCPDLVVDALFGIGLSRPLPAEVKDALDANTRHGAWHGAKCPPLVALDCPSGLDADTGRMLGDQPSDIPAFQADLTVTFHAPKVGHYLAMGPSICGKLSVVDIGLHRFATPAPVLGQDPAPERVRLVAPALHGGPVPGNAWPCSQLSKFKTALGHKYDHGSVLVFGGGTGQGGRGRRPGWEWLAGERRIAGGESDTWRD